MKKILKSIARALYYFGTALYINLFTSTKRVSFTSRVKNPQKLMGPCKIGAHSYLSGSLGKYSYIGTNCKMYAQIGNFCSVGNYVEVVCAFHPIQYVSTSPAFYSNAGQCVKSFVEEQTFNDTIYIDENNIGCIIGNDVWIGDHVLIKGGVTIGDGAVLAMGAVVTHDVAPYSIVAGVPAKEIKKRFTQQQIDSLQSIQWWGKSSEWINTMKIYNTDIDLFIKEAFLK